MYAAAVYGGATATSIGFLDWINTKLEKLENRRIKEVIEEGNLSIRCTHFPTSLQNVWDAWKKVPYINKFQLGNRGKIEPISVDEVNAFCGWE